MKSLSVLLLLVALSFPLFSQNYSYSVSTGLRQFISELRPNARLAYPPPKDDVLSDWQSIPFPWNFYGKPVSGFYISDNGYMTFDTAASVSVPGNTFLPSPAAPRSSIFAFWEDLHTEAGFPQWSNEVRVLEWGTAPNRVLVIMWTGVVPAGATFSSSNTLAFAIALLEGGDFDVIFVGGNTTVRTTASIGVQNADRGSATMVDGSPDIRYPSVTADPNDDISYRFAYSNSAVDLALDRHYLQPSVKVNIPVTIKGVVKNVGSQTINGFTLSWNVDGGPAKTETISGIGLASNQTYIFTHTEPWTPDSAGRLYRVGMFISQVNGSDDDQNIANNALFADVFTVLGVSAEKRVLVEEFTGAWCGWCPDGALQMSNIENQIPKAVLLAVHAGGTDSMIVPEGAAIAAAYKPSYPQGMVDRTLFPGQASVPMNRSGNAWLNRAIQQLQLGTPVSLQIQPSFDPVNRMLTADVKVLYEDFVIPGDQRLHVIVVEDRVTGAGRGYDQNNYYSGNASYPNHPYFGESNPIKDFVHRHVPRVYLTGAWGEQLPSGIPAGGEHARSFSVTLPAHLKHQDVEVVAFVSNHSADITRREVLNANSMPLFPHTGMDMPVPDGLHVGALYPNPASGRSYLRLDLPYATEIRVDMYDALGRNVARVADSRFDAGPHFVPIQLHGLAGGLYSVRIAAGARSVVRPLLVTAAR